MAVFPLETHGPAVAEVTPGSGEGMGVSPKCCWAEFSSSLVSPWGF